MPETMPKKIFLTLCDKLSRHSHVEARNSEWVQAVYINRKQSLALSWPNIFASSVKLMHTKDKTQEDNIGK